MIIPTVVPDALMMLSVPEAVETIMSPLESAASPRVLGNVVTGSATEGASAVVSGAVNSNVYLGHGQTPL